MELKNPLTSKFIPPSFYWHHTPPKYRENYIKPVNQSNVVSNFHAVVQKSVTIYIKMHRISESIRKRFDDLREQIALLLLSFASLSLAFPHIQNFLNNIPKEGLWKAAMTELTSAWPSLLAAFALIMAAFVLLGRHKEHDDFEEMNENIKEIKNILSDAFTKRDNDKPRKAR